MTADFDQTEYSNPRSWARCPCCSSKYLMADIYFARCMECGKFFDSQEIAPKYETLRVSLLAVSVSPVPLGKILAGPFPEQDRTEKEAEEWSQRLVYVNSSLSLLSTIRVNFEKAREILKVAGEFRSRMYFKTSESEAPREVEMKERIDERVFCYFYVYSTNCAFGPRSAADAPGNEWLVMTIGMAGFPAYSVTAKTTGPAQARTEFEHTPEVCGLINWDPLKHDPRHENMLGFWACYRNSMKAVSYALFENLHTGELRAQALKTIERGGVEGSLVRTPISWSFKNRFEGISAMRLMRQKTLEAAKEKDDQIVFESFLEWLPELQKSTASVESLPAVDQASLHQDLCVADLESAREALGELAIDLEEEIPQLKKESDLRQLGFKCGISYMRFINR